MVVDIFEIGIEKLKKEQTENESTNSKFLKSIATWNNYA